jgi:uncharacterized protein (DUF1778 family)
MSMLELEIPDELAQKLQAAAEHEGISVTEFVSLAAEEKLAALTDMQMLRSRSAKARRKDFLDYLDNSPNEPPLPSDRWE